MNPLDRTPRHPLTALVERRATKAVTARKDLEAAICDARDAGIPLRTIATAAQMSHESVRRLVCE